MNVGSASLAGPVTVTDDKATVLCPSLTTVGNGDAFLDPREQVTCTASHTVTQADLNAGQVTNRATAAAGGVASNQSTVTVPSAQQPAPTPPSVTTPPAVPTIDLQIQKTARPNPVTVGGTLTYTLIARNNGPSTATNVVIADSLPATVTYLSSSSTQGTCIRTGQLVNCAIGTMPVNATVTVTIRVRPLQPGTINNVAVIVGAEAETNTASNRDEEPTRVVARFQPRPTVCPTLHVSTEDPEGWQAEHHHGGCDPPRQARPGRARPRARRRRPQERRLEQAGRGEDLGEARQGGHHPAPDHRPARHVYGEAGRCHRRLQAAAGHGLALDVDPGTREAPSPGLLSLNRRDAETQVTGSSRY